MPSKRLKSGFTLIELMLVVAIIAVMGSIFSPRVDLLLQKATQAKCKSNLGSIRSSLALYYSEQEGHWPMQNYAAGIPTESLSATLAPRYIETVPVPKILDRIGNFNGLSLSYDTEAQSNMGQNPAQDIVIIYGPQGPAPFINRPFVYDPSNGLLYMCNDNYDLAGSRFYEW